MSSSARNDEAIAIERITLVLMQQDATLNAVEARKRALKLRFSQWPAHADMQGSNWQMQR